MAVTVEMRTQVSQLYYALFGRAPDAEGLGYWVQQLSGGKTVVSVADDMFAVDAALQAEIHLPRCEGLAQQRRGLGGGW